jgi:phospholipid/cholesterol/gamma-HCH transport system substrate-binding protein
VAGGISAGRVAGIGALLAAVLLVALILFGAGDGHTYRLQFQTGGQLVKGNQVLVGGQPIGTVDDVTLTEDNQAEVKISVDEPLHEGTTAVIRSTSLSGIANRYVSITQGPDNAPELPDNQLITQTDTTTPVDLDQLFNTFRPRARRSLQDVIQGFGTIYAGDNEAANKTYKYLAPGLSSTRRVLDELTRDQQVLTEFLVDSSRVVTGIAQRRDDLSSLTSNANSALGAIAQENVALDRSLRALPPAFRQANTTFVNLRATLDDLDPLFADLKVGTRDLAPFLRHLRPVVTKSVPVFKDLRLTVRRKGKHNDLASTLKELPSVHKKASRSFPAAINALNQTQDEIAFARPYAPDLVGWLTKFGEVTSFYDGNGHYARVESANSDLFRCTPVGGNCVLQPIPVSQQFADLDFEISTRCPGGVTQPIAGSNPFLDDGNLSGDCDPGDVPPGP